MHVQAYLPLELGAMLDLLQVDLLASGASLVWPQATKSGEVDLSCLMGFPFAFRVKNGEWRDLHLEFQVSFASPCLQWRNVQIPLQLNLLNMCVYLHHQRSKFVYFVRKLSLTMIKRKLTTSGGQKKTKTCFNPESILGKEISQPRNLRHPHTF